MKYFKLASLAFVFAASFVAHADARVVRFASVADFKPYNYLNDEGVLRGFENDLQLALCKEAAIECAWVLAPWDELQTQLGAGEFDVIMSAYQITDARKLYVSFSATYIPADPSAVLAMAGDIYPSTGSVVGALSGTLQAQYVTDHGWSLASYSTPGDAIQALLDGKISAFVADQSYLKTVNSAGPDTYSLVATDVIIGGGIGMAVSPSEVTLLGTLNTALATLKSNGTLDDLIGTWFDGRDPNYRGDTPPKS